MNLVHLHTHSHYSLLDGLAKIPDLVGKAKGFEMPALALTDHGNLYGAIEFYKTCAEAGIQPILGCELYLARRGMGDRDPKLDSRPFHLTVLAKNMDGYKNLIKLVSAANLEGFYYKPRVDKKLLKRHSQGLIFLSGCLVSEFGRAATDKGYDAALKVAREYISIVGAENYFLEIQPHPLPEQQKLNQIARQVGKTLNRPVVVTSDIHYLNKDDEQAHEVLLAVNTGKDLDNAERMTMAGASVYMMSDQELEKALPGCRPEIENTLQVADQVKLELDFGSSILPSYPLPKGEKSALDYLTRLSRAGLSQRYKGDGAAARQRLDYELSVIEKTGFADYFLIVSDFVRWAKERSVGVGPGRGSAAGSIVSYCLSITNLDPIKYNLMFERFLNPERLSMPDIDLDFADDRRGEVIDHITATYGQDHVAQIITFGLMKARSSVRDVTRALNLPYSLGDQLAKLIPFNLKLEEALRAVPELRALRDSNADANHVLKMAAKLEGVARHASTHAAGVIISKEPLTEYVPLQRSTGANAEGITTQYSMYHVESIGLLKIDILGLANLTIIKNCLRVVKGAYGQEIDIDQIPLDDRKTFTLLSAGETIGVFQLESAGMRRYIKELRPERLEDIMAMVALYRPGPIELIPDFIAGKQGKRIITYLHPLLEPILKDTYGIAVYQEQILEMARQIAGFSYGEADVLRKAIGKKIRSLLLEQRKKFIAGAIKNNIDQKTAEKLFDFAEPFARYGFNRAHAASYALIAYQTAYLKANFPAAFLAALLTSAKDNHDKIAVAIEESEHLGIAVLPPHINQSFEEFGVVENVVRNPEPVERVKNAIGKEIIRYGLNAVKNVGEKAAEVIVGERMANGPYQSLEDFLGRVPAHTINKKVLEALICAGALEGWGERNRLLAAVGELVLFAQELSKSKTAQQDLFGNAVKVEVKTIHLPELPPTPKRQLLAWEKELLGIYLSDHPLKSLRALLEGFPHKIAVLSAADADKVVEIAGILNQCKKIITKSNEPMMFCEIEDLTGKSELVVFPSVLKAIPELWRPETVVKVKGRVNLKDGAVKILVMSASELDENQPLPLKNQPAAKAETITLSVPATANPLLLQKLKTLLLEHPGNQPVELKVGSRTVKTNLIVSYDAALKREIELLFS